MSPKFRNFFFIKFWIKHSLSCCYIKSIYYFNRFKWSIQFDHFVAFDLFERKYDVIFIVTDHFGL